MHGFDAGGDDSCTPKRLEPAYRSGDSFDGSMVLPGDVVEVFALTRVMAAVMAPLLSIVIFSGT